MNERLHLANPGLTFGADPEVFVVNTKTKRPTVIGSELVIKEPLKAYLRSYKDDIYGTVEPDGVQAELHPRSGSCRAGFGACMSICLDTLRAELAKHPNLQISFDQMVSVKKSELVKLSDHAKFLGCTPSLNIYGRVSKEVNGLEYRKRSAAGHVHIGSSYIRNESYPKGVVTPERLVPALDILVGIPGVLMDRDPAARERRKLYGRAGEYRLPKHGLEYRTLSNFWLISYPIMSLVLGQVRNALCIAFTETPSAKGFANPTSKLATNALNELIELADLKKVEKAINTNNFDLAYSIYEKAIKPVMSGLHCYYGLGMNTASGDKIFEKFEKLISKPLKETFPGTIFDNWSHRPKGWERFAYTI